MTDTPETDKCVKQNKHLKFLQEDVWVNDNKITYENPIVGLCQKLERERDWCGSFFTDNRKMGGNTMTETLRYWIEQSEHECDKPLPIGSCLACDLLQLERELTAITEQRDVASQCHKWCYEDRKRITKELTTVTEQRNRLAEALEYILGIGLTEKTRAKAEKALLSLTNNQND
jgi:hypothetical protein